MLHDTTPPVLLLHDLHGRRPEVVLTFRANGRMSHHPIETISASTAHANHADKPRRTPNSSNQR